MDVDSYTGLTGKQRLHVPLILAMYDWAVQALDRGADVQDLVHLPAREEIGRAKYVPDDEHVERRLRRDRSGAADGRSQTLLREGRRSNDAKEYRTIQEVAGPLMVVRQVEGVTYDELGEIELPNGDVAPLQGAGGQRRQRRGAAV